MVFLADRYGLSTAAKACISAQMRVPALMDVCSKDQLAVLSSDTLQHLVATMTGSLAGAGRGCGYCEKVTLWSGDHRGYPTCNGCHYTIFMRQREA